VTSLESAIKITHNNFLRVYSQGLENKATKKQHFEKKKKNHLA
jgi:ribosome maturation factor RimP